ncbi:hypothetical protein BTVI_81223 [Pitangus sulphuratus]|nr:hypothetical protein BTVI_81223 [Pitangus sulphuratus]
MKMIKEMEPLSYEDRLREQGLFSLEKRRLQEDLRAAFKHLKSTYKRAGEGLFIREWKRNRNLSITYHRLLSIKAIKSGMLLQSYKFPVPKISVAVPQQLEFTGTKEKIHVDKAQLQLQLTRNVGDNKKSLSNTLMAIGSIETSLDHYRSKKEDPGNYRPVSLPSVPGKVTVKIILKLIEKHLKDNNVIGHSQHSFMRGKSCLSNLISFYDKDPSGQNVQHNWINTSRGWEALQRDLNKLEDWAVTNNMKFKTGKCQILHLGQFNPGFLYRLRNEKLESSAVARDLGVLVDGKLNLNQQCPDSQEGQPCPGGASGKTSPTGRADQAQLHHLYSQNSPVITILVNSTPSYHALSYQYSAIKTKKIIGHLT